MEFKRGANYTRSEIHTLYFGKPMPRAGSGNWPTGYVVVNDELIAFMNIDVPGSTGHDFANSYDEDNDTIVWFGKPNSHSGQPIFQKLLNGELKPHFFARWEERAPFTYLGVGKIVSYEDGHPTITSKGDPATTIRVLLTCEDAGKILPRAGSACDEEASFTLEKYLEEFIVDNWATLGIGNLYDINEESVDGKRKKFRTDTGEVDIFAISKDKKEYLIVELKKGRASDNVVGQIQRYMGYVKDEIAKDGQRVKGLIIALEDDLRIKRALSINPDIDFYRYKIKFELENQLESV